MSKLKEELLDEIESFREEGHKFLNGDLSMMEFKHKSGGFGVYAERNKKTFMIRLRIPSGITNVDEMKWVLERAKRYNLDSIHLTTRQAIQYHNLSIDDICEIMRDGLNENIFTRGAGGNFPRNVAMSPLSGVDKLEAFDVTPYAIAVNNYFLKRITTYKLPRKLKVSFSSSNMDCGHCSISDLGFLAVVEDGKKYFKLFAGGGLGQNPKLALDMDELVNPEEVLYYVDAMVRMYMAEGNYENRSKARVRYMVDKLGEDGFKECYRKHLAEVKSTENFTLQLHSEECTKEGIETDTKHSRLFEQKQKGLYSVYFHPIGGILQTDDLEKILNYLENVQDAEIRLAMTEGMYIRNLNGNEADKLLEITQDLGGETHLEQSVSCIGVPTCQIGLLESQKILREILDYFKERNYKKDVLPRVQVSGCGNSCGIHQACMIGLTGKKKKVDGVMEDAFEIHINGSFENNNARLGKVYGIIVAKQIPEFLFKLSEKVEEKNINFEEYINKYEDEFNELISKYI